MNNLINKIHHADCLEFIKDIPDKSIDLILTDSPYKGHFESAGGMAERNGRKYMKDIRESIMSGDDFNIIPYLKALKNKMRIFNAYFWCSLKMIYDLMDFAKKNNFNYNLITWFKPDPIPLRNNTYLPDCEWCVFIRERGAYFNSCSNYADYYKVFIKNVNKSQFGHPTEKPLDLMYPPLKISSKENDLILDPFSGSGTTAIACHRLKRRFICIEKEKKYVEMSRQRLKETQAQLKLFN